MERNVTGSRVGGRGRRGGGRGRRVSGDQKREDKKATKAKRNRDVKYRIRITKSKYGGLEENCNLLPQYRVSGSGSGGLFDLIIMRTVLRGPGSGKLYNHLCCRSLTANITNGTNGTTGLEGTSSGFILYSVLV